MSAKAQKLAARYGRKSDIIEIWEDIQRERNKVTAFTNPQFPIITVMPEIQLMNWGLIPFWTKTIEDANEIRKKTYNARSETVFSKNSFRDPIKKGRCLIPSTGYYEWHHNEDRTKTPYRIYVKDIDIFSIAGIFDQWTDPKTGECFKTFSMITTRANELTGYIHNGGKNPFRMPAIILPENEEYWLNPNLTKDEIEDLLLPISSDLMGAEIV